MLPELQAIPESCKYSIQCLEISLQVIPYLDRIGYDQYIVTYNTVAQGDIRVIFMNCQIFGFNLGRLFPS